MGRRPTTIVVTFLCGIALMWAACSPNSLAQHATPEANAPAAITSEVLGRAAPATVENPELSLGRVTVMPGAVLPVHYHPGTQIGVVVQEEPYMIGPGETVVVRPGDALVEPPSRFTRDATMALSRW